jgi:NitT/TauT family transport system substrate-binding protein
MRIAVPDFVSSSFFPLIVAKELGIFKVEGQDVEIVHIPALGDVEALRDGAVDFSAGPAHSPLLSTTCSRFAGSAALKGR